jgi:hypothetical protein
MMKAAQSLTPELSTIPLIAEWALIIRRRALAQSTSERALCAFTQGRSVKADFRPT